MFSIGHSGLDEAFAALDRLAGDLPRRALADALNHTANQARIALRAEMESVFDRPTPFTLNALRILNARPDSLEAAIWVKDDKDNNAKGQAPEDWVAPQVFGGPRVDKKSEMLLRRRGILPAGRFVVPAEGARMDAYGNMSRAHMMQILSGLRLLNRPGYTGDASNNWHSFRKGHAKAFFVMRRGKVPIGIAERRGRTLQMVLAFVGQPSYRQRLDFHGIVRRMADERLAVNVDKAVTDALAGRLPTSFRRRPQAWPM